MNFFRQQRILLILTPKDCKMLAMKMTIDEFHKSVISGRDIFHSKNIVSETSRGNSEREI